MLAEKYKTGKYIDFDKKIKVYIMTNYGNI